MRLSSAARLTPRPRTFDICRVRLPLARRFAPALECRPVAKRSEILAAMRVSSVPPVHPRIIYNRAHSSRPFAVRLRSNLSTRLLFRAEGANPLMLAESYRDNAWIPGKVGRALKPRRPRGVAGGAVRKHGDKPGSRSREHLNIGRCDSPHHTFRVKKRADLVEPAGESAVWDAWQSAGDCGARAGIFLQDANERASMGSSLMLMHHPEIITEAVQTRVRQIYGGPKPNYQIAGI
jgi:hypothetical protein